MQNESIHFIEAYSVPSLPVLALVLGMDQPLLLFNAFTDYFYYLANPLKQKIRPWLLEMIKYMDTSTYHKVLTTYAPVQRFPLA